MEGGEVVVAFFIEQLIVVGEAWGDQLGDFSVDECFAFLRGFLAVSLEAAIRARRALAGSSFGSCGTSLPAKASFRMD